MKLEVLPDVDALLARGAEVLEEAMREAVERRGRCVLAASGGRTPWGMYEALAGRPLPWEEVHVVQVDERIAPRGSPERNLVGLETALARVRGRVTLHPMPVEETDLEAAAAHYATRLADLSGELPAVLDVVHLGLGADGHTASLVPRDPVLEATTDVALAGPYQGRLRMTLTRPVLDRARRLVWVVAGREKAAAVERLMAGDAGVPAGLMAQERAILLLDREASPS